MRYSGPLTIIRPLALAAAVALNESRQGARYAILINRLVLLEDQTRAAQKMPAGLVSMADLSKQWQELYLEIQNALSANASEPLATMNAETEVTR